MRATIIVSNVNSEGMLLLCIQSLCNQSMDSKTYEVILPDYGAISMEERALLGFFAEQYAQFTFARSKEKNRARLIDDAVRQSSGRVIFFLESHCIPRRSWLEEYLAVFRDSGMQAATGSATSIPSDGWFSSAEAMQRKRITESVQVWHFDFHNSAMRRALYDQLGGLKQEYPLMAEYELGVRLFENGIKICRVDIDVLHANTTRSRVYRAVIGRQGFEKAVMMNEYGVDAIARYFVLPRVQRYWGVIRCMRVPLMLAASVLRWVSLFAFSIGVSLRISPLARASFLVFAVNSHRAGMLRGLGRLRK